MTKAPNSEPDSPLIDAPPPPPGRRAWVLRLSAASIGLAVAVGLAELVLRVFHLAPVGGLATASPKDFDRVPGLFMPGQRLIDHSNAALPYQVTIDSLGFRGEAEFPRLKPPGEFRVLVLGDSFAFGSYVNDYETLPAHLERRLREACQGSIRVINAALGGSSIITADAIAGRALPLGIDLAVLTFSENDVSDLSNEMWYQLANNRAAKSRFPLSWVYPVVRNLAIWNLLLEVRARSTSRKREGAVQDAPSGADQPAPEADPLRAQYADRFHKFHDRLQGAGVAFVYAIYPSHRTLVPGASTELVQWADSLGRTSGVPTVSLLDALRTAEGGTAPLYLLPYDGHPSGKGHGVVAEALADQLLSLADVRRHCTAEAEGHRTLP